MSAYHKETYLKSESSFYFLQHQQEFKQEKRFQTVDQLFDYIEENYDDAEIEETLDLLMKSIDKTREKQGERTLFNFHSSPYSTVSA